MTMSASDYVNEFPTVSRAPLVAPLDPHEQPVDVPVLIIGGGPVGLTAAMLLARLGVEPLVLERRDFSLHHPRAHLLNVRTMEIFSDIGVAEDIYAMGPSDDRWRKVTWYTSVTGPTPLHGRKLGEVQAWGGGTDSLRYAEASPRRFTNLPQTLLDPLLRAHADALCPGRIRPFQEVIGFDGDYDGPGVCISVLDRTTDERYSVHARYVIFADGGRTSEGLLGVQMDGVRAIREVVNQYVTTDLSMWDEPDALLAHFISPDGKGHTAGTLQALGPRRYGRESTRWLVAIAPTARAGAAPAKGGTTAQEPTLDDARRLLGVDPTHPMTLHALSRWQYEGVVARKFRYGPVFLAGDAAHRHPPTGGLGLNCGVQDAQNLAWKLAAVLFGRAPDRLLDSYESERRPVAAAYTAHSLENAGRHRLVAAALGLHPGQSEEDGWHEIEIWASDDAEGAHRREAVAKAIAANAADYSQLNIEAGYAYEAGALILDGTPPPKDHDSPITFVSTNRPGHHMAHVWTYRDAVRISTIDLVFPDCLTLFTGESGAARWRDAARSLDAGSGRFPVRVVTVGPSAYDDLNGAWERVSGVDDTGAVLVRPDRHVAWRGVAPDGKEGVVLEEVVSAVMSGESSNAGGRAVEQFLERIRTAAERLRR